MRIAHHFNFMKIHCVNVWRPRFQQIIVTTHKNYYPCCKTSQNGQSWAHSPRNKSILDAAQNILVLWKHIASTFGGQDSRKIIVTTHGNFYSCCKTPQRGQSWAPSPRKQSRTMTVWLVSEPQMLASFPLSAVKAWRQTGCSSLKRRLFGCFFF